MPSSRRRSLLSLLLTAALASSAPAAWAQAQVELAGGASVTRDSETTAALSLAWLPRLRTMNNAVLRWELGATHLHGRDNTRLDLKEDVTVAHAGVRYERTDHGLTLGFGIGAQGGGRTDALSGNPQFVTTAGWRWSRFSLLARHISNASLKEPNDGETMLLAAWRF